MAHSSTKHNKIQRRKNFWGYLFIAPNFIGFVVFMLLPILMSLYYSFTDYDVITEANFVGFENYIKLFQDDQFITALLNTLWYCVLTVPAGVILALLLAVLFTVFSRVNEVGEPEPLEDEETALERWGALWELKRFPEQPIRDYLEQWKDRFWLFHPERPFWQVPEAAIGTEYGAAKLNGEMSESSNKIRLFPLYAGAGKTEMTYAQAVRWLLSVNGYDDTSAKPRGKGLPSVGAGWLGKIGYIQASGENLFETLMLNLTLLKDGTECWGENKPCWELDAPKSAERTEILQPDNPAQLLTLQSRRLLLHRENGKVDGFSLLGGDFFPRDSAFVEQMTIWRNATTKKNEPPVFVPCRHDAAKQFWREFPSVFCKGEGNVHQPGVVRWVEKVQQLRFLSPKRRINFRISAVQYGDKDFFVNDSFSDSLAFQAVLLDELGRGWQNRITEEIGRYEQTAFWWGTWRRILPLPQAIKTEMPASRPVPSSILQ